MQVRYPACLMNMLTMAGFDNGTIPPILSKIMMAQWRNGLSIEFGPVEDPYGILLFYPVSNEEYTCGILTSRQSGQHLRAMLKIGQLSISELAQDTGCKISCKTGGSNSPGFRIAKMAGFKIVEQSAHETHLEFAI
ncbi:MAG: hypothetical protein AAF478_03530 [Pseudomonadota bacterium]